MHDADPRRAPVTLEREDPANYRSMIPGSYVLAIDRELRRTERLVNQKEL